MLGGLLNMVNVQGVKEAILDELKKIDYLDNEIVGFISKRGDVYTVGSDSKIIGRLFEVLTQPILEKVATQVNMELHESPRQTVYPDFWLSNKENSS